MNRPSVHARIVVAAAVLVVACAPGPTAPPPTVGPSPQPSPRQTSARSSAPPSTLSASVRAALGEPGVIAVANIEHVRLGWLLSVDVVRRGNPVISGSIEFRGDGWKPRGNDGPGHPDSFDILTGSVRIAKEGWAAIEVDAVDTQGRWGRPLPGSGVVVLDIAGDRGMSPVIAGSAPVWLPDGTLLLSGGATTDNPHDAGVRRVTDHGFGDVLDLVVPAQRASPSFPLNYIVHGDLSGIEGFGGETDDWGSVTVRWDGTLVARKPKDPPYLALGVERSAGSEGQLIVGCDGWGPCALEWQRRGGRRLSHPSIDLEHAWTRDGDALVVLDGAEPNIQDDDRILRIQDSASGLVARTLAQPVRGELDGGLFFFRGMSDWAVALERDSDLHVNVIPLDGSPVIGPIVGTVALVNP